MKFTRLDDGLQRTGIIEAATENARIAWVAEDANGPRRLLERATGFELRTLPDQVILPT